MIVAVVVLTIVCLALIVSLDVQARRGRHERENADARWKAERSELINRIQRPDVLPARSPRTGPRPVREPKDLREHAQVGTVTPLRPDSDGDGEGA